MKRKRGKVEKEEHKKPARKFPKMDDAPFRDMWIKLIHIASKMSLRREALLSKLHAELLMAFEAPRFIQAMCDSGLIEDNAYECENCERTPLQLNFCGKRLFVRRPPQKVHGGLNIDNIIQPYRWDLEWLEDSYYSRKALYWKAEYVHTGETLTRMMTTTDLQEGIMRYTEEPAWREHVEVIYGANFVEGDATKKDFRYYLDFCQAIAPKSMTYKRILWDVQRTFKNAF